MVNSRCTWTVLFALLGLPGCGHFLGSNQAHLDFRQAAVVEGLSTVVIETRNGSIEARCEANASQVEITGTKYGQGATMAEAQAAAERIVIQVERPADRPGVLRIAAEFPPGTQGGASFRVVLPTAIGLDLHTSNAFVSAIGAAREANLGTSNGSINADGVAGKVVARTTNASITIRNVMEDVEASSSNGSIHLQSVGRGRVVATTTNASIEAHATRGDVRLTSSNGHIEWAPSSLPDKPDVYISTANASLRIKVPTTAHATLGLSTTNASVHAELSGARIDGLRNDRDSLSATLNGGGGQIEARTSNGRIDCSLAAP
jgi:hypothetical protein